MNSEEDYDRALALIHESSDEDERGFTNHAAMVIDALVGLERPDWITRFLDSYLGRFPTATTGRSLGADALPGTHRGIDRAPDWTATWHERIEAAGRWQDALEPALGELAPALFSGATHGLLRVAHAAHALERSDTPVRRFELARGLGYWCARHQTLPGRPGCASKNDLDVASLIAQLGVIAPAKRKSGLFTEGVRALDDHLPFAEALARLRVPDVIDEDSICDATTSMLEPFFESPLLRIAYVHTITAPSSLRFIVHLVDEPTRRSLFAYGVQAMAALHAISELPGGDGPSEDARTLASDVEQLRTHAADTLEEHVIKFSDACLREHAARPDGRWRLAAADAVLAHESRRT